MCAEIQQLNSTKQQEKDSYHKFAFTKAGLSGGEDRAAVFAAVLQARIS